MRLGLTVGNLPGSIDDAVAVVKHAEALGFDSAWTSEAWGKDAVTLATWLLAHTTRIKVGTGIMQMSARTPSMTAMTAMSLQEMSGGRFVLGIGPSGPQVIEGWHGEPFGKPLARTREYIQIIRKILAREAPLEHHGEHYQIPNTGPGTTGLGKALKTILHPDGHLPIYTGSFMPAGIRTAAAMADGTIPIFMDPERFDVFAADLEAGFARAGGTRGLADFDLAPFVKVAVDDDVGKARDSLRAHFARYIGGMGARDKNFYNDYARSLGYEAMAREVQDLYLDRKQGEAAARVSDEFIDAVALVGPPARVRERLQVWKSAGEGNRIGTLIVHAPAPEALELLADGVL